jgi:uncharacterized membrane protein
MDAKMEAARANAVDGRLMGLMAGYFAGLFLYLLLIVPGVEATIARQAGAEVGDAAGSLLIRLIPVVNLWLVYRVLDIPHRAVRLCFSVAAICTLLLIALGVSDLVRVL